MNKQEYHKYLNSLDWLLKKNELISIYLKEKWKIECKICYSTDKLRVHHINYENIGKEVLTDERIWDLSFLCEKCHYDVHFNKSIRIKYFPKNSEILIKDLKFN